MSMTSTECHVLTCTDCATSLLVHHPLDESTCPICISTNVERTNVSNKPFLAERLQPFRHQKKNLPALFKTFTRGARFRCRDLHPSLLAQRAQPLFIPSWLVDATLEGHWSAEAGYNYQVQSSVDVFHKGQWQTEIVEETRVRFDDRVGTLHRRYNDQHVSALESDMPHGAVLSQISNHSDAPAFELSQWEQISIVLPTRTEEFAKEDAQRALHSAAAQDCAAATDAVQLRGFDLHADMRDLNWTWMLHPIYTSYYRDDKGGLHLIIVNDHTGDVFGPRWASVRRGMCWSFAFALAAFAVGAFGLVVSLGGFAFLPLFVLGPVIILCAFLPAVLALYPAVAPWIWNARERRRLRE